MKLNPDCIRDVLLTVENCEYQKSISFSELKESLPKYSYEDLAYTCEKLKEAGYITVIIKNYVQGVTNIVKIKDITYPGHEFLNSIRDDSVWHKTKEVVSSLSSISLSALSQTATSVLASIIQSKLM